MSSFSSSVIWLSLYIKTKYININRVIPTKDETVNTTLNSSNMTIPSLKLTSTLNDLFNNFANKKNKLIVAVDY